MTDSEEIVARDLVAQGARIYHTGWPDFLVLFPDGRIKCVEVKSEQDTVKADQNAVHEILRQAGLTVEIVGTNKLQAPIKKRPRIICPGCSKCFPRNVHGGVFSHDPCGYDFSFPGA
jgi:hypothetical protein